MKKAILIAMSGVCALSLAACSDQGSKEMKTDSPKHGEKADTTQNYPTKTVNNVEMKIENIKTTENGKGDKNIVQFNLTFKNNNDGNYGVGGNDFILKSGDKMYTVKADANNIGTEIGADKTVKGSVNFEIPKGVQKGEFSYKPVAVGKQKSEVLATWNVTIPEAK
jgi:hypothetical protein